MISGIYRIVNGTTGKYYLGSSKDIIARWVRHRDDLEQGGHHNLYLQRAWEKYGKELFGFEIIEECYEADLLEIEQGYLDNMSSNESYNIGRQALGGDNFSNHPNKNEIRSQISTTVRMRTQQMSSAERKALWSRPGPDNPNFGRRWPESSRAKMSERLKQEYVTGKRQPYCKGKTLEEAYGKEMAARLKNNLSDLASKRLGEKNPFFGRSHTDETRARLSEKRMGKYDGSQNKRIAIDNIEYRSAGHASELLDIPMTTVRWRVRSENPKFENYKYVEDDG